MVFSNVLLFILSTVALANQPEFKAKPTKLTTNRGADGAAGGGAPFPAEQAPPSEVAPGEAGPSAAATSPPAPPAVALRSGGKPPATSPPKPGRYRYRITTKFTRQGQQRENTREIVIIVETLSTSAGETRQTHQIGEGGSSSQKQDMLWRPQELIHLRWYSEGEFASDCNWEPDLLFFKFPLQKQAKWEAKSACETTMQSNSIQVDYQESSTVSDSVKGDVAGTSFEGWQIDRKTIIKSVFEGHPTTQNVETVEIFSPGHGLIVKSTRKGHGTSSEGAPSESETTMELLSFVPA